MVVVCRSDESGLLRLAHHRRNTTESCFWAVLKVQLTSANAFATPKWTLSGYWVCGYVEYTAPSRTPGPQPPSSASALHDPLYFSRMSYDKTASRAFFPGQRAWIAVLIVRVKTSRMCTAGSEPYLDPVQAPAGKRS